jgi:hypothetical protein
MAQASLSEISKAAEKAFTDPLGGLRRRIRSWIIIDGLGAVALAVLIWVALDFALDYFFRFDRPQRMALLSLGAVAALFVAWRKLASPLQTSVTDDALLLRVEQQRKGSNDEMISAWQFARMPNLENSPMSHGLTERVMASGAASARAFDFSTALNSQNRRKSTLRLVLSGFVLVAFFLSALVWNPANIWLKRNLLLGNETWPQSTYLEITNAKNGVIRLPRGEDLIVEIAVRDDSKVIPSEVMLQTRPSRSGNATAAKKTGDRAFEAVFKTVVDAFEMRAVGGDETTAWVTVELAEPPMVKTMELSVTNPKYAGGKIEKLPSDRGPFYVLKGSSLEIRGTTNKQVKNGEIRKDGVVTPLVFAGAADFTVQVPKTTSLAGKYEVHLTDDEGMTTRRPSTFSIADRPDRDPKVQAKLVGISAMVVPKAIIPIEIRASDDFAVSDVYISYSLRTEDQPQSSPPKIVELPAIKDQFDKVAVGGLVRVPLEPLQLPEGASFSFFVIAKDNDDVSGPKEGKSTEFVLKVVSEDQLRTDLLRREKEQRQEFERHLKNQDDLNTECRSLMALGTGAPNLPPDQKQLLMQLQRRQKVLVGNVAAVADRFESIHQEVVNNQLEEAGGPLRTRLTEKIITPMRQLSMEAIPAAILEMDRSRRLFEDAPQRQEALAELVKQQDQILVKMREILSHLVKTEGYQEAINLLYEIQKTQQEVMRRTYKEQQDRIKAILEQGGDTKQLPKPEDPAPTPPK